MKTKLLLSALLFFLLIKVYSQKMEYGLNSGITYGNNNIGTISDFSVGIPLYKKIRNTSVISYNESELLKGVKLHNLGFSTSLVYRINMKKMNIDLLTGLGYTKINSSKLMKNYQDSDVLIETGNISKESSWNTNYGINVSYNLNKNWSINTKIQKKNYLNSHFSYNSRDISSAIKGGAINYELVSSIPFENQEISLSNVSLSIGIKYLFTKKEVALTNNYTNEVEMQKSTDTTN